MRYCLFFSTVLLFFACNNNSPAPKDTPGDTIIVEGLPFPADKLVWVADYDTLLHRILLKKQRAINPDSLQAQTMINDINAAWENVRLVFKNISHDTLYVTIPESDYLTQQMGSSGAQAYISSTTYNLTELRGIRFISYNFAEGDHLAPGVYGRKDFEDLL